MFGTRKTTVLTILSLASLAFAGRSAFGEACDQNNTHLDSNTWNLDTDCDATTYCADNNTCATRGCRSDVYPYGYNGVPFANLPPLCPDNEFCPDEGSQCMPLVPIGGRCQKDRDDECQFPSNWQQLAGYLNVNGTVCLNFTCLLANVTLGQTCIIENTPYTAYTDSGSAYAYIVSRDNCANGLYCDGNALQCYKAKAMGVACTGNKECLSYNCLSSNVCGRAADQPIQPASWAYVLVGLGIVILIVGTLVSLWFFHRRSRKENQIRLEQYYNEQMAYRQSIMSMSMAKNSLLGLPANVPPDESRRSIDTRRSNDLHRPTSTLEPNNNNQGYSSQVDLPLPPNLRRESSMGSGSDAGDTEVLLMTDPHQSGGGPRFRG